MEGVIKQFKIFLFFDLVEIRDSSKYLIILLFVLFINPAFSQVKDAKELTVRSGLPNFFSKISKKDSIVIGYLGGSITEAQHGWSDQSLTLFRASYKIDFLKGINSGVGGTASDLGACRLENDILRHSPDLVFIEYALNDIGKPDTLSLEALEGIIRQVWINDPYTDICLVYSIKSEMFQQVSEGIFPDVVKRMESLAKHYGIPSIHMGLEITRLWKDGLVIGKGKKEDYPRKIVFAEDGVHPLPETGHFLYTRAIERSFKTLSTNQKVLKHSLPTPLTKSPWESATMVDIHSVEFNGKWLKPSDSISDQQLHSIISRFPGLRTSAVPGSSFTINFEGTMVGIYDVIGPHSGQYWVRIDDQPPFLMSRFDAYCFFYRPHYFFLDPLPHGKHKVTFTIAKEMPDKQGILKKLSETKIESDPAYSEKRMYVSKILLQGKLIDNLQKD